MSENQEPSVPSNDDVEVNPASPDAERSSAGRAPAAKSTEPARKKRRRRWPWVVAAVVVVLLAVVALLPMIASTGPARSFVLGKINQNISGRITAGDFSIGWFGGLKLNDVKLFDADGREVVAIGQLTTELSLLDLIRGDYSLGETYAKGNFNVRRDPDGRTNLAKAMEKPGTPAPAGGAPAPAPTPAPPQPAAEPTRLPNLSGNIRFEGHGSYEDRSALEAADYYTVQFQKIDLAAKIPDINSPIENSVTVVANTGAGRPSGTLKTSGTVDAVDNNVVNVDAATVRQRVDLENFGLAGLGAFLPVKLDGTGNGSLDLDLSAGKGAKVVAQLKGTGVAIAPVGGKGDPASTAAKPSDYDLVVDASSDLSGAAKAPTEMAFNVSRLSLTNSRELVLLEKLGDGPLQIKPLPGGRIRPTGGLRFAADLKWLNDVLAAFGDEPVAVAVVEANGPAPESTGPALKSGRLAGTLQMAEADGQNIRLTLAADVTDLTAGAEGGQDALTNENVKLAADLTAKDDLTAAKFTQLEAQGSLLTVTSRNLELAIMVGDGANRRAATLLEMPRGGSIAVQVPQMEKVLTALEAMNPPAAPAAPAAAPVATRVPARPRWVTPVELLKEEFPSGRRGLREGEPPGEPRLTAARPEPRPPISIGTPVQFALFHEATGTDVIGRPARRRNAAPARIAAPAPVRAAPTTAPIGAAPEGTTSHKYYGPATINLDFSRDGDRLVAKPQVVLENLLLRTDVTPLPPKPGDTVEQDRPTRVMYRVGRVVLKTEASLVPAAPPAATPAPGQEPSLIDQIRDLRIPSLEVEASDVAKAGAAANEPWLRVSLAEPSVIGDLAAVLRAFAPKPGESNPTPAKLSAVVDADAVLAKLLAALDAFQGVQPGTGLPYGGQLKGRQTLAAAADGLWVKGSFDVRDFVVRKLDPETGEWREGFSEQMVRLANNVGLDSAKRVLTIADATVKMQSSQALELDVKGVVREYGTERIFEGDGLAADVTYDAARLWEIIEPTLTPEQRESYKNFVVEGRHSRKIVLQGSYPAEQEFATAVGKLKGTGGLELARLFFNGIDCLGINIPWVLDNGVLRVPDDTPPIKCNGDGMVTVAGMYIDLRAPHPRLTLPKQAKGRENEGGYPLLRNLSINPLLADTMLASFVNPVFDDARQARGLLNVTVVECRELALGEKMYSPDPKETGRLELKLSLTDAHVTSAPLVQVVNLVKPGALNEEGVPLSIPEARVVLEGGKFTNAMTVNFGEKYAVGFDGGIALADKKLLGFNVAVPRSLIARIDKRFASLVPNEGLKLPLTGTTENWVDSARQAIVPQLAEMGKKALLNRLIPGADGSNDEGDEGDEGASTAGATDPKDVLEDLAGGLLNQGGSKRKKETAEEKRLRREKVRRERAERESRERQGGVDTPPPEGEGASGDERIGRSRAEVERERRERERD